MRWWGSKPQSVTAQYLDSVAYFFLSYPALPAILFPKKATTRFHPPTWASPVSDPESLSATRGHSHLGVSRLRPSMPTTHPVLPIPSGSGSYCMPISPPIILLPLASRKYARVAQICFSIASWRHHASLLRPPPSYPVSLAHTSNKGRRATPYATVT